MVLECPHCHSTTDHTRSQVFGQWVICPACERPFAWRETRREVGRTDANEGVQQ